uniref:Uncharacterized protein n=1 Tax=Arundo donax TaxID=35708 RepID=A0A0A9FSS4_ARUDO
MMEATDNIVSRVMQDPLDVPLMGSDMIHGPRAKDGDVAPK